MKKIVVPSCIAGAFALPAALLAMIAASPCSLAEPAGLDPAFGSGGTLAYSCSPLSDLAQAVVVQPDGKIVIAGYTYATTNEDFMVARFLANGVPDPDFGNQGVVITSIGSGRDRAHALALQGDGKIVVAGFSHNGANYDFAVVRYLSNGVPDTGFHGDGITTTSFGSGDDHANAMLIQSDGKIVVAGSAVIGATKDFAVARYLTNGSLDTGFDTDGKATVGTTSSEDVATGVGITGTGRIVLGGTGLDNSSGNERFAIVRLTATGSLDTTFGTSGVATPALGSATDRCFALAVQSDNKILAAGSTTGSTTTMAVVRLTTAGSPDSTFDGDGIVTTGLGTGSSIANAITVQGDGKIVVAGNARGNDSDIGVVRYLANGSLDAGFSGAGKAVVPVGSGTDYGHAVAVQSDGMIVAAGATFNGTAYDVAMARLSGSPVPEISVEFSGVEISDGSSANFIARPTNGNPTSMTYTLRNAGSATLENIAITKDGAHAADFTVSGPGVTSLAPGNTASFTVSFLPSAEGARSASLHIISNDSNENPFDMPLAGTGLPALISTTNSPLPHGMFGVAYEMNLRAKGGVAPYSWSLSMGSQLPPGLALSQAGLLSGTPTSVGLYQFSVNLSDSDGNPASAMFSISIISAIGANQLDSGFGSGGKILTQIAGSEDIAQAVLVQPDQKILVAGHTKIGSYRNYALVRYEPDGTPDTSFGNNGIVTMALVTYNSYGRCIALQPDGKILMAGDVDQSGGSNFGVVRFLHNGSPDPTFGSYGKAFISLAESNDYAKDIFVQPDGKIVIAGAASVDFGVARLMPDGSPDTTFGTNGTVVTDIFGNDYAEAGALQADGKIVVAGRGSGAGGTDFILARFLSNGSLDTSFGSGGKVATNVGASSAYDICYGLAVQGDGNILACGYTTTGHDDFALARYLPNGSPDTSFGAGGIMTIGIGNHADRAYAVALQPNGAILVAGSGNNGTNDDFGLVRLLPNGSPDTGFATNGGMLIAVGNGHDRGYAMALQADGRIIVAGEAHNGSDVDFGVARYTSALSPDISVSSNIGGVLSDAVTTLDFGTGAVSANPVSRTITIRNSGTAALTGIGISLDGSHAGDFSYTLPATTILAPGASIVFPVVFQPVSQGVRSAVLHIACNDPDENPFDIPMTGTAGTPLQAWRQMYFGTADNTGYSADLFDYEGDGVANLFEYAFSCHPFVVEPGVMPLMPPLPGGQRAIVFRCDSTRTDLTYTVQASSALQSGTWVNIARSTGGATTVPLGGLSTVSDSGSGLRLVTVTPAASLFPSGRGFLRVSVEY